MISQSPNMQQNFRYGTKGRNHNAVPVLRMSCIYGKDLFTVSVFVWSWTWGIRAASAVFMHSDALIMIALPEAATQRRYWSIRRTVGTTHLGVLWNTLEGARRWIDRVFVFKLLISFAEVFCSICRADSTPLSLCSDCFVIDDTGTACDMMCACTFLIMVPTKLTHTHFYFFTASNVGVESSWLVISRRAVLQFVSANNPSSFEVSHHQYITVYF